jgi:homoserine dehydrogenase
MPEPVRVGVVGLGTVGSGVVRLLVDSAEHISRQAGRPIVVERAVCRDVGRDRGLKLPAGRVSSDIRDVSRDPSISVVALLVGGLEPARSMMIELLEQGKDVVTANKALLAEHGPELFELARRRGRSIAFEAAVAGGIPIVAAIAECLAANRIESIRGILNGTSNFILSRMEEDGADYAAVLKLAQDKGYAEADPSMDVDGTDATQKLAILAHLAFGAWVPWAEIPRTGIEHLDGGLLAYARELGYRIRLVAVASRTADERLALRLQRREHRGRRRGKDVLPRPRRRPDAHRLGRGGRHHRHRRRPRGDHLPDHRRARRREPGPHHRRRLPGEALPARGGGRPPRRAVAGHRDPRRARRLDRVGDPARARRRGRRAARDHDPRLRLGGHAPGRRPHRRLRRRRRPRRLHGRPRRLTRAQP